MSAATQYWYRVRAYNATGPSAFAGPASATTLSAPPSQPPSAPTGLTATKLSGGRITLTWTDSSNNETGFSIERSPDGQAYSQIATVAQNVSTYVDTSPGSTKFVFYRVRAFNLAGNSAYTGVEGAQPLMRRKEGVMRYVTIAMAASRALHLVGQEMRAAGAPASTYSITDLGSLGGGRTTPMGINNRGAVVGFSATVDGLTRAFLYTGGSLVDLGTLGGDESFAYRINDKGLIVGRAQDASGRFHAFVTTLTGGAIELTALDPRADGDFGAALGVSSVGEVAGYYTTAGHHMIGPQSRLFLP